ncbi:MAG: hypothetical protein J6M02_00830 [Clostridia bacterium]|nr:hypothetical protein [Clostridia bacterium]
MTAFEQGMLIILCAVIFVIIIILVFVLMLSKKKEEEENKVGTHAVKMTNTGMAYEDIKKFLPFDEIKDNMIVQEMGERFTMLVECQGINYYLMSEAEKISVEEGFIQFLNALRFPIQIYVQTRTVNLDESIDGYNKRLQTMTDEFNKLLDKFQVLDRQGAPEEQLLEVGYALQKKEKVVDYTKDLIDNISYLTQNTNVLQKKYYIAVSYHISEMGLINNFDKEDNYNMAYNELLNRAQSICNAIASCGIEAQILNTTELTEVMYIAINRDDSDLFNIKKIVDSDIGTLATTARDPMLKRQDLLREEKKAREVAAERDRQLEIERQRKEERERRTQQSIEDGSMML